MIGTIPKDVRMSVDDTMSADGSPVVDPSPPAIPPIPAELLPPRPATAASRWQYHFWVLAVATVVLGLSLLMDVSDETSGSLPLIGELPRLCTWQQLIGADCPGCGLTRSFSSLAHGDWIAAWNYNAAGWLFFAICIYQLPFRGWQLARIYRGLPDRRHSLLVVNIVVWTLLIVLITQWIAKVAPPAI